LKPNSKSLRRLAPRLQKLQKKNWKSRLAKDREIKITVIGMKSGKTISRLVWFVLEGDKLYRLPVQGSDTQSYQNTRRNPWIEVSTKSAAAEFQSTPITGPDVVSFVVEKFREKYGARDVKKFYSKFDVAVVLDFAASDNAVANQSSNNKSTLAPA
jgi:hypothetical protein